MWDERFSEAGHAYGTEPNDYLRQQAGEIPAGGEVLSLAEGQGRNAAWLAQQGFRVTAMDSSAAGIASAQRLAAERGVSVRFEQADLKDYSIQEGRWDGIVLVWAPMPPDLRSRLLADCARGLRPGGVLIYAGYGPRQPEFGTGGPSNPEMLPPLDEVKASLTGLHIVHAHDVDREVLEGKYHTGMSNVIEVTARR